MPEVIYKKESFEIIGACFEVHKELGAGFLESVYQESLALEFSYRNVPADPRLPVRLHYKGQRLEQFYVLDFICYGKIIVEIKATKALTDDHRAQTINYLKATGYHLGLLVNFGTHPRLQYERFAN